MTRKFVPLLFVATSALAQAPNVVSVSPSNEAVGASRDADLLVTFDTSLDAATVGSASFRVFGHWSGPMAGSLSLESGNTVIRFTPDASFQAGERVLVQLSRAITAADGTPLAHGYMWGFWSASSSAPITFEEIDRFSTRRPGDGPVVSYGAYGADLNNDGFNDLAVVNEVATDIRVFLNDGAGGYGSFDVLALPDASVPSPSDGADFNGDGELDLVVGSAASNTISVLLGDGIGDFASIRSFAGLSGGNRGVTAADFDGDGWDDIVTSSGSTDILSLFRGRGDGTFDAATPIPVGGSSQLAIASADANADGILDLFVGDFNGHGRLLLGDGDGGFTTTATSVLSLAGAWMAAAGDVNGDGFADVTFASSFSNGVQVYYSDGAGGFLDEDFVSAGEFGIAMDLGDLDGDGDLDGVISSGGSDDFIVLENVAGTLSPRQTLAAVEAGSCATLHDRDNNGTLDITGIDEIADLVLLFESAIIDATESAPTTSQVELVMSANPFTDRASMTVRLDEAQTIVLRVFDARGREVATLVIRELTAGEHHVLWDASAFPSGVYIVRLDAAGRSIVRRITRVS